MPRPNLSRRSSAASRGLAALLVPLCASVLAVAVSGGDERGDEAFIRSLQTEEPVDTKRLARFFFSVASTLDGGRTSVQLLEEAVSLRDPAQRSSVQDLVRGRYQDYADAVGRFKSGVSRLLDRPDSPLRLYQVLVSGHRACWLLGAQIRLVNTYGATGADLMSVLSSSEACDRFRRAAFQPQVEAIVETALSDESDIALENRALREELRELEKLLEDLRRIEEAE